MQTFRDGAPVQFHGRECAGDDNGYMDLVSSGESGDETEDDMPPLVEAPVPTALQTPDAVQPAYRSGALTAFAEPIPAATGVVDLTETRAEPPRIEVLRRIHLQEMSEGFAMDPSWCACPNCEYSRGDLRAQRYVLMKRLYQVNAAIHGPLRKQHVSDYELLHTLI